MHLYLESQQGPAAGGGPVPSGGLYSDVDDSDSDDDDVELGRVRLLYKNGDDDDDDFVPGSLGARAAEIAELVHAADDPDELSINRCWRKAFKGATTGRRLKRLVCKFGTYQMLFGGGLMGIAAFETITYPLDEGWFAETTYGWSVRYLTWCVCAFLCLSERNHTCRYDPSSSRRTSYLLQVCGVWVLLLQRRDPSLSPFI